jgi:hypothetical protein
MLRCDFEMRDSRPVFKFEKMRLNVFHCWILSIVEWRGPSTTIEGALDYPIPGWNRGEMITVQNTYLAYAYVTKIWYTG